MIEEPTTEPVEWDQKVIYDQLCWQEKTLLTEIIALRTEINRRCESCGEVKLATLGECVKCKSSIEVVQTIG